MKCPKCNTENKDTAKFCKKCKFRFEEIQRTMQIWNPDWKWHLKTLGIIYVILIILYFSLNIILKPHMRKIPADVTPWLQKETGGRK